MLSDVKARNINHVIEALPVGKAMWMVTEYCGGGSIATLVSPNLGLLRDYADLDIVETHSKRTQGALHNSDTS